MASTAGGNSSCTYISLRWFVKPFGGNTVVEDGVLPRRDAAVGLVQVDAPEVVTERREGAGDRLRTVAQLDLQPLHPGWSVDPVGAIGLKPTATARLASVRMSDGQRVVLQVLADHVPWAAAQAQAETLPDRVKPVSQVCTQALPGGGVDDGPFALSQVELDELAVVDLAEKTDALAVLAVAGRQLVLMRQAADLGLGQVTDREARPMQLRLCHVRQEIRLVLYRIGGA